MALTKKHYEQIAARIAKTVDLVKRVHRPGPVRNASLHAAEAIACDLTIDFEADNPRFDRQRFLTACGF